MNVGSCESQADPIKTEVFHISNYFIFKISDSSLGKKNSVLKVFVGQTQPDTNTNHFLKCSKEKLEVYVPRELKKKKEIKKKRNQNKNNKEKYSKQKIKKEEKWKLVRNCVKHLNIQL